LSQKGGTEPINNILAKWIILLFLALEKEKAPGFPGAFALLHLDTHSSKTKSRTSTITTNLIKTFKISKDSEVVERPKDPITMIARMATMARITIEHFSTARLLWQISWMLTAL